MLRCRVNAISNISFFLAAWFSLILARKVRSSGVGVYALILLIFLIGVGSALFHTFANRLTEWLDIIPIFLFQICLLWLYERSIIKLSFSAAVTSIVLFLVANIIALQFPSFLNGSLMYLPAMLAILFLGVFHAYSQTDGRWLLSVAFVVFCISLFFRTIDDAICSKFPIGTHFLWHILNGFVLYLSARAIITSCIIDKSYQSKTVSKE